ncbi:hypothetical protein A3B05_03425 [Candidatus Giovannonibacteria bacterium RIFCSPLOWO2_01_FULL_43_160]|uniref:Adenylyl-sulfate kinase n=3 Tax=Parcubacteria group TaxID=1794811 RepID=A0A0G1L599_9BACT|nr:MAG: hypothetical protein UU83_C0047G0004 [Candidatus Jorgensenbacteria bacterium GW2011_GWF2_41_8]KKS96776.1 MAG: hypothetical protein UV72_C0001G0075 [Candidatus Giovannonibacteria bacterium GW2011_GWB1_43_13]KKS99722.1 MAG: hypothetical protein UV75_C0002G0103 [Candidatus Giovannonibacteria bacterium GW2011_GWA1_43_15]KKT21868.1 MAG: hypothetical protein UW05_C0001G0015 [Candidatus Giovannonibacteria bacterium GW2011_GWC2_43_8]KKT63807.1 MAG: hypothetical protein UW55_C0001G0100 [Candidat
MKSKKPKVVAIVGLVGSGKSSVAKALAKAINAKVIEGDVVRVALRKHGKNFGQVRNIVEKTATSTLKNEQSVVLDSDFVDPKKCKSLEKTARANGIKVFYIRVFSDRDIMIGRLISAKYTPNDLFGGASTDWLGKNKGAVVALREMWRRTPHHYRWSEKNGGTFLLKKLPIKFIAEIDTTSQNWKTQVKKAAKKIRRN